MIKVIDSIIATANESAASAEPILHDGVNGTRVAPVDNGLALTALRAFASMARLSQRHQAEVEAALHRAGLSVDSKRQAAIVRYLADEGCIDGQIPLSDGAMILTVTAVGMTRAGLG